MLSRSVAVLRNRRLSTGIIVIRHVYIRWADLVLLVPPLTTSNRECVFTATNVSLTDYYQGQDPALCQPHVPIR